MVTIGMMENSIKRESRRHVKRKWHWEQLEIWWNLENNVPAHNPGIAVQKMKDGKSLPGNLLMSVYIKFLKVFIRSPLIVETDQTGLTSATDGEDDSKSQMYDTGQSNASSDGEEEKHYDIGKM